MLISISVGSRITQDSLFDPEIKIAECLRPRDKNSRMIEAKRQEQQDA